MKKAITDPAMLELRKIIGTIIHDVRMERGETQADLADKLGVTLVTIGKWESGSTFLSAAYLLQICMRYNKTPNELLRLANPQLYARLNHQVSIIMKLSDESIKRLRIMALLEIYGSVLSEITQDVTLDDILQKIYATAQKQREKMRQNTIFPFQKEDFFEPVQKRRKKDDCPENQETISELKERIALAIGEQIKKMRIAKKMSSIDLAKALGVSQAAVSKWETGKSVPEVDNVIKLCQEWRITPNEFFDYDFRVEENYYLHADENFFFTAFLKMSEQSKRRMEVFILLEVQNSQKNQLLWASPIDDSNTALNSPEDALNTRSWIRISKKRKEALKQYEEDKSNAQ